MPPTRKLLWVLPRFGSHVTGGAEGYVRHLAREMGRRGHGSTVLTTFSDRIEIGPGYAISWPPRTDLAAREEADGMSVERFPVAVRRLDALLAVAIAPFESRRRRRFESRLQGPAADALAEDALRLGAQRHPLEEWGSRRLRGPSSPALLARLAALLPTVDAVIGGYLPFGLAADVQALARRAMRPFLLLPFAHASDSTHHYRWHYRLMRESHRVLALSRFNQSHLFEPTGAQVAYVGAGPSHDCAAESREAGDLRAALGIPASATVVLCVARKTAYKGYPELLQAVAEANRRGTEVVCLWVGPDEDAVPVHASSWRHLGRLDDAQLCRAARASDVFCLFSRHESFGMVVLDAWRHRLPVVVNRLCGPTSELVEGGAGLAVDARDLAATLERLAGDVGLRRHLGEAGHRALHDHSWSAAADRLEAALSA